MRTLSSKLVLVACALLAGQAFAGSKAYTRSAGKNAPKVEVDREVVGDDGIVRHELVEEQAPVDHWGNAQGNNHDLAVDGAFEGQTVAVIQLYTIESRFDFSFPKAALKEKGFSTYRWVGRPPSPSELASALEKSSQLWIIAGESRQLTPEHIRVIRRFFDAGHGVYIWGDNEPYYADANYVAEELLGTRMTGNVVGDQTVPVQKGDEQRGLLPNHLLTTGLEHIYEGITIATLEPAPHLQPLIYGSAGNLVTAFYDHDGKRAILDGGFTRLYIKWDTAGTARYVKNAAAWLVNAERFGDAAVVSNKLLGTPVTKVPAMTVPESSTAKPVAGVQTVHAIDQVLPPVILILFGLLAACTVVVLAVPRLRKA